ncbi:hypothetical protein D3OALGB2SA_4050 [Olavius algarvensis associated proteobacterium Delta 3]|nr:hypothetical protein D3OALGB2SA_4050 [Olavius algarvensis associated proteobacterium Delta 3]
MIKVSKGQDKFNLVTDLEKLLKAGPGHLKLMGTGHGGFSWEHHLSALMIVACLADLEAALGKYSWHTYGVHIDEFEALRHIRNAYVHAGSDLAKLRDANGIKVVRSFHTQLTNGKVLGVKGQTINPYFALNGTVVELKGAIRRARSLYLQVMKAAKVVKL